MSSLVRQSFTSGAVIFRQGESSSEVYHVLSGRVGILLPRPEGDVLLAELGPGSLFGEMALINGPPRTATAVALEAVEANVIPESLFRQNTVGLPEWALSIARVLADRLKNTTLSLDKLLYEKSHSVEIPGSPSASVVSIVPQSLEVLYYPESDTNRLYLSGTLDAEAMPALLNQINGLRRQGVNPIILSFSQVVDAQRRALAEIVELARGSTEATGRIQLENVQFIADKLQGQEGFQDILLTTETPLRRVGYGDYLIKQGEVGDEMYVVKTGSFTVSRQVRDKEVVLWTAEEGDVIGEMALISGKARSASVLARKSSQVYVIRLEDFRKNAYHVPRWFMGIIEGLVTRLRETNKKLDSFVNGSLHPVNLTELMSLDIFENVTQPGVCKLAGSLTSGTLPGLRSYVRGRLNRGVRNFVWDVTAVPSVDPQAVRYLVKLHRYLLNVRGTLKIKGSKRMQFPVDL